METAIVALLVTVCHEKPVVAFSAQTKTCFSPGLRAIVSTMGFGPDDTPAGVSPDRHAKQKTPARASAATDIFLLMAICLVLRFRTTLHMSITA
jgi:hypothetical protein